MGPVLFCIYINDLPLHILSHSAECHNMLADDTTLHTTGRSVVQIQKTLQLCLDRISVWCNVNHMPIIPVKTKPVIITTRQKHQLSDLSLRLSLGSQNIENVTEHRLLGLIVDYKFRWQAQTKHIIIMQKHVKKTVSFFSTATYHQHRYQKTLLQRSHKTSHRLCVSSVGWLWRSTLKNNNIYKKTELPTSRGRQINPS